MLSGYPLILAPSISAIILDVEILEPPNSFNDPLSLTVSPSLSNITPTAANGDVDTAKKRLNVYSSDGFSLTTAGIFLPSAE